MTEASTVREALAKRFNMERTDATEAQLIEALIAESVDRKTLDRDAKWLARQAPDAWAAAVQAQEALQAERQAVSDRQRTSAQEGVKVRQRIAQVKRQAVLAAAASLGADSSRKAIARKAEEILCKLYGGTLPDKRYSINADNVRKYLPSARAE